MTDRLVITTLAVVCLVGTGPLAAQTTDPAPPPPAASAAPATPATPTSPARPTTPDNGAKPGLSDSQIADQVDAKIAALKADLRLSADQNRDWLVLEGPLHDIGIGEFKRRLAADDERSKAHEGRRSRRRNEGQRNDAQPDAIDGMRREADALTGQADTLRRVASASEPLFRTLNDDQKRTMLQYFRRYLFARGD